MKVQQAPSAIVAILVATALVDRAQGTQIRIVDYDKKSLVLQAEVPDEEGLHDYAFSEFAAFMDAPDSMVTSGGCRAPPVPDPYRGSKPHIDPVPKVSALIQQYSRVVNSETWNDEEKAKFILNVIVPKFARYECLVDATISEDGTTIDGISFPVSIAVRRRTQRQRGRRSSSNRP